MSITDKDDKDSPSIVCLHRTARPRRSIVDVDAFGFGLSGGEVDKSGAQGNELRREAHALQDIVGNVAADAPP